MLMKPSKSARETVSLTNPYNCAVDEITIIKYDVFIIVRQIYYILRG